MPMYNVNPYFSLKNLGEKSTHYTWQNTEKLQAKKKRRES